MNDFEDKMKEILVEFAVANCTADAARIAIFRIGQYINWIYIKQALRQIEKAKGMSYAPSIQEIQSEINKILKP